MATAVFLGFNALGDTICSTPVVRAFRRANPDARVFYVVQNAGFCRILDGNPDIDLIIYNEALYLRGYEVCTPEWIQALPLNLDTTATLYRFDMNMVCSKPESFQEHISVGLSRLLQIPIDSIRPVVVLNERDRRAAKLFVRRPYLVFSMHSLANPERTDGRGRAKEWPLERWAKLAERAAGWGLDVFSVASEFDPLPMIPDVRPLHGLPIRVVAALIEGASCFVTLENGLAHLAGALDAPTVEIYSNLMPLPWAHAAEATRRRFIYGDPFDASVEEVCSLVEQTIAIAPAA